MIEDVKIVALKGHDVFSLIGEKLSVLLPDFDGLHNFKQKLSKDQQTFKEMIEQVQLKLTSPTLEQSDDTFGNFDQEAQLSAWRISDTLVRIKRLIAETVDEWNLILQESVKKRDADKKKEKSLLSEDYADTTTRNNVTDSELEVQEAKDPVSNRNRSLDQEHVPSSPKSHHRSQSDGTILSQYDDSHDGRKQDDKKTVKHIFSQLLPSATVFTPLQQTFSSQEHCTLPTGIYFPIIVYENEPSSIIAYALNCYDYKRLLDECCAKKLHSTEHSPSPSHKRLPSYDKDKRISSGDKIDVHDTTEKSSGLLSFLRNKDLKLDVGNSAINESNPTLDQIQHHDKSDDQKKRKSAHIEIQFEDAHCNFFCRIYFADEFTKLRNYVLPTGEEAYIRSLTRSVHWNARGGKSGSTFCKTTDDRFILKEMPKSEIQLFLEFAPNYFTYMNHCHNTSQPTLLGKIVGIYQIIFKNNNTNASLRTHVLVMENLFYNRIITQRFDLKGSMRNRLVNPDDQDEEIVLLDENLLKMSCDSPLYIYPHSKTVLTAAIQKDTEFLSAQSVMDYSLLVGLDTNSKELVVGIIDYIRTFTWDKRLETMVKKSGILWGQGKLPTIVSPEEYRDRFIEAMHKYFLQVPDPWTGFGKGLEY